MRLTAVASLGCLLVQAANAAPLLDLRLFRPIISRIAPEARGVVTINMAEPTAGKGSGASASYNAGQYLSLPAESSNSFLSTLPPAKPSDLGPLVALADDENKGGERSKGQGSDRQEGIVALMTTSPHVASSTSRPSSDTYKSSQDAEGWVNAHNAARSQYGARPLIWDDDLSVKAMGNAKLCSHEHSSVLTLCLGD